MSAPAASRRFTASAVRFAGGWVSSQSGMAEAGAVTLDVEQVLDREGQARERPLARAGERDVVVAAEGAQGIVGQGPAGGVIRPRDAHLLASNKCTRAVANNG